jgi:hypothetical protein
MISSKVMNTAICISLNQKTLKDIDANRGLVSRSAWINDILNKDLKRDDSAN